MGNVNVVYKPQNGSIKNSNYQISKLRLASGYFRIQRVKGSVSQIFTSLGKAIIIYNLLQDNDNGQFEKSNEYLLTDPTEKGVYSYYLGMTTCKWVSEELFNIPILQYYSLESRISPLKGNITGTTCPDLIGVDKSGQFLLFEAKGTHGRFSRRQIVSGKKQIRSITIFGNTPNGIVTESYFKRNIFSIYAEDPTFDETENFEYNYDVAIENYYHNIIELLKLEKKEVADKYVFNYSTYLGGSEVKIQVGLNKEIYNFYIQQNYASIRSLVMERLENIERENEFISSDGISFKIITL